MPRRYNTSQVAASTPFDPTGTGLTSETVQDAIEEVQGNIGGGGGGAFDVHCFESLGTTSTTSNGYVNKINSTSSTLSAGDYKLDWCCEMGMTEKSAPFAVRVRLDSVTIAENNPDFFEEEPGWRFASGFHVFTLASASTITVQLQFGQTDDGGTLSVRNARICVYEVNKV